jgi:alkylhydroperoxidase/carboxymuconolactone decarboxylase family protein YurZ
MEQTSSSAYPNILAVDYIKKARVASSAKFLMTAEQYLNVGYQKLLTFERPGGGFDWWGSGEPLVWLSAYGLQEFNDMAKVYPIDRGVITRTQAWLMKQMGPDGTWSKIGATHGEAIERMGDPKLLLTSYVVWALADSGFKGPDLKKSIDFIRAEVKKANNAYILALAANALAAWDANDDSTLEVLKKLATMKQNLPEQKALCFPAGGQSLSYGRGDSMTIETTALAALAMLKTKQFANDANKALVYLIKAKDAHGTWGSTQATILALKALVPAAGGAPQKETAKFSILVGGKQVAEGEVTEKNSDVLQMFDLNEHVQAGANEVTVEVKGETGMMYQVVARHFEPWVTKEQKKPVLNVAVDYDRTKLATSDLLKAKATLKYNGEVPTYMVIVDLGIPPGFTVDGGDFAEMVAAKKVQKFSITARQATLYLGDVKPGDVLSFEYGLKPKYPVKVKTPATVAYEYYTPANRVESKPAELTVTDKK